jgi:hypothetical protein
MAGAKSLHRASLAGGRRTAHDPHEIVQGGAGPGAESSLGGHVRRPLRRAGIVERADADR